MYTKDYGILWVKTLYGDFHRFFVGVGYMSVEIQSPHQPFIQRDHWRRSVGELGGHVPLLLEVEGAPGVVSS